MEIMKDLENDDEGDNNISDVHAKYYSLAEHLVVVKVVQR
jgi:hypothetical protein